eukprot:TRINITY_DN1183_c0_g1_i1.p1 TRINITY_DN1183_c0_g1~~TRINITY_DN1183_c0_g1_i1.p1  ORF type:complete len:491 (-),score=80.70 TRINITY_DN1183_c0_g1_i1:3175-4647(-)
MARKSAAQKLYRIIHIFQIQYTYSKLNEIAKGAKDRINLYAVVLDSSAPYYMESISKYQCTMKLIDPTMNPEKGEPMTATIFAKTSAQIPHVTKVGSIIRLHRAQTKEYKKKYQLNCDVNIKGAWILFDPSDGVTPVKESGKNYTFTSDDKAHLLEIRKFAKSYFAKNELEAKTLKEAETKKPKDFDTLCMVMEVKKKGNTNQVKVCDAQKVVKMNIPTSKNLTVAPGEIIRIRSADYADKKFETLELNEYSNILRVPADYKSAKEILNSVQGGKASEKVKSKLAVHTPHLSGPMTGSKIIDTHKQTKASSLKDMFTGTAGKPGQKYFKVHVNVSEISPKNPKNWIYVYEKKTKKEMTLDEAFKGKKTGKLPAGMEYFYKFQLYVQDKAAKDTDMYILMVSTLEDKCPDFIKLDLGREYPSEKSLTELKRIYKTLTNPFVTLDMMVEVHEVAAKQPVFFVVDTALTIQLTSKPHYLIHCVLMFELSGHGS